MSLPTRDELLRAQFDRLKAEANSLVQGIADAATPQYLALAAMMETLAEYSAYFGEPLSFEVRADAQIELKGAVIQRIGPMIKAVSE